MCAGTSAAIDVCAAASRGSTSIPTFSSHPLHHKGETWRSCVIYIHGSSLAGGRRAGKQNASPAPYSPELANATDPARCASFHPKRRVLASSYRFGFSRVSNLSNSSRSVKHVRPTQKWVTCPNQTSELLGNQAPPAEITMNGDDVRDWETTGCRPWEDCRAQRSFCTWSWQYPALEGLIQQGRSATGI